jgi:hypothetical protein
LDELDPGGDYEVEEAIRRFLGAVQSAFGKLVKNGWLDGIRAKVENSIQFLPFTSHQHWHAVGSSRSEHQPQKMAEHIKEEVDAILAQTCPWLHADVMVALIPSPEDLRRWIKYMNKTTNIVEPVESVYNRHPNLRRDDPVFEQFVEELRLFPQRSRRVFAMNRHSLHPETGTHTYMLHRRYVRGNHQFGKGSILSEPKRHREWRKRHAERVALARRRAKERKKKKGAFVRRRHAPAGSICQPVPEASTRASTSPRSAPEGSPSQAPLGDGQYVRPSSSAKPAQAALDSVRPLAGGSPKD